MQGIWKVWMYIWCGIAVLLGLELAGAALPATDLGARAYFAIVGGFTWEAAPFDAPGMRFAVGVLGAILMGWGLTVLAMVRTPAVPGVLWRGLTLALVAWFVVDSLVSILAGYPLNAVLNAVFLATYLIPVRASGVLREENNRLAGSFD